MTLQAIGDTVFIKYSEDTQIGGIFIPASSSHHYEGQQALTGTVLSIGQDTTDYDSSPINTPPTVGDTVIFNAKAVKEFRPKGHTGHPLAMVALKFIEAIVSKDGKTLQPISDRILIQLIDHTTQGIVGRSLNPKFGLTTVAIVVALPTGKQNLPMHAIPFSQGDTVSIEKSHAHITIDFNGHRYQSIRLKDIQAVLDPSLVWIS